MSSNSSILNLAQAWKSYTVVMDQYIDQDDQLSDNGHFSE